VASLYVLERAFAARVRPVRNANHGICWLWTGLTLKTPQGLRPILRVGNESHTAAHVSYTIFRDPIASGLHLRRTCSTECCVHPLHLERRAKPCILRPRPERPPRIHPHVQAVRTKEAGTIVRATLESWETW